MQRRLFCAALATLVLAPALAQQALGTRPFPANAKRGRMTPGYFPEIVIDGKVRRLAPAARIVNADNMAEVPAALRGTNIIVNYTENADGDIDRVWILTAAEARLAAPAR
ncbi:hypothetical protein IP92_01822 [Pseudoduganella flava]|uniref:Uncharacterized protein n=1 Tax=Pseudoduganella flava TaxID=871742 RepID=A0A562PVN1_9BURK|nr:hypothetical protein [Pseudoduganella flava]QGZ39540.1 hypothetical protein GO485_11100 [Pseudoduganella flava]TWI48433.1 hypothetical protein IP92_01822 [Pseudoduganella flava]